MKNKLSFYKVAVIAILLLIIVIGSMILFINPDKKNVRKQQPVVNEQAVVPVKPVFRKDGELRFVDDKTSNIISTIEIEVAATDAAREQGLMYRDSMAENTGMLFLMETEEMQSFWMKNTIISLDIIYVNSDRSIVSIHKYCKPYSLDQIQSASPALYVVEVIAGYTDKYKIEVGDRISF